MLRKYELFSIKYVEKIEKRPFSIQKRLEYQLKFVEWADITFAAIKIFNRARATRNK